MLFRSRSHVPESVAAIVERALRLRPDERPANGSELAELLGEAATAL